jgi:hypothetical protein
VAYASDYTSRYYGSVSDDPWCYRFSCGHSYYGSPFSLSIGLFFGRPYRRYYYDPYFYAYDPFYNPFFYDPYYYSPVYHPYYYDRPYYSHPYRDRLDDDNWYRGSNSPFTRYRFRSTDGVSPLYRDRNVVRRAVNTVYLPPISPIREPASSSPVRRIVEPQRQELRQVPRDAGSSRRVIDDARRVLDRPIEAHRARPAEQEPSRSSGEPRLVRREVETREQPTVVERSREEPRQIQPSREEPRPVERAREAPRQIERPREEPRQVERPREEPRRVERSAPAPDRGGGSSGSDEGSRRRR